VGKEHDDWSGVRKRGWRGEVSVVRAWRGYDDLFEVWMEQSLICCVTLRFIEIVGCVVADSEPVFELDAACAGSVQDCGNCTAGNADWSGKTDDRLCRCYSELMLM